MEGDFGGAISLDEKVGAYDASRNNGEGFARLRIVVCTDRCPNLLVTRVVAVHKRWPASKGLFHMYEGDSLKPMPAAESRELIVAYREAQADWGYPPDPEEAFRAYVSAVSADEPKQPPHAILCTCLEKTCEATWPTKSGHLIESPNNPYVCHGATLKRGKWEFAPD